MPDAPTAYLFGDSHLDGPLGLALDSLLLELDPQLRIAREAWGGSHVGQWIGRLQARPAPPGPLALVLFVLGTNDYLADPSTWAAQVGQLAALVESWSGTARLVWVSAPVLGVGDTAWQVDVLDAALDQRWTIVDSGPMTADLPLDPDGVHRWTGNAGAESARRVVDALARFDAQATGSKPGNGWMIAAGMVIVGGVLALLTGRRRRSAR